MTTVDTDPTRTFARFVSSYCDVNALGPNWREQLAKDVHGVTVPEVERAFKMGLADAMQGRGLTQREYKKLTGWEFPSEAAFHQHLRELWDAVYPREDPNAVA